MLFQLAVGVHTPHSMRLPRSQTLSILLHTGVVFALLHLSAVQEIPRNRPHKPLTWAVTKLEYHLPPGNSRGGGSGFDATPARKGVPPRTAPRQFVPPTTKPPDHNPLLPMEPTIIGQTNPNQPPVAIAQLGDPSGLAGPPSNGSEGGTGIGKGKGGSVGPNRGPSIGDGDGGMVTGNSRSSTRFTQASVLYKIEPEFTEEARKARFTGTVVLVVDIDERGIPHSIRVQTPLGLGLDEKAIEAVRKWRFRPATQNGKPIASPAVVEVHFHLL